MSLVFGGSVFGRAADESPSFEQPDALTDTGSDAEQANRLDEASR